MSPRPKPRPAAFEERAPYEAIPSSKDGELGFASRRAQVADLNAPSFSETSRTPVDGFTGRDQSHFPTRSNSKGKQS